MFKFTIRPLLLLTVIVGLVAGWIEHRERSRLEHESADWLVRLQSAAELFANETDAEVTLQTPDGREVVSRPSFASPDPRCE